MTTTRSETRSRPAFHRRRAFGLAAVAVCLAGMWLSTPHEAGAIVGGEPTRVQQHPWIVSIADSEGQFCGGSLISSDLVLTAAHCVEGYEPADLDVTAGATTVGRSKGQSRGVDRIIAHPRSSTTDGFDIALLELDSPVRLTRRVRVIAIATRADTRSATSGSIAGWGAKSEHDESAPARLREAAVPIVPDRACKRAMRREGEFVATRRELCAGGNAIDTCYGDSGGPLVVHRAQGQPVLAGVTSWGIECGGSTPGVYVEAAAFREWIRVNS